MCDTIIVQQDDGILFAKNSDRDPNEAQLLEWHPARSHPPGASLRCTWIEIPQVRATNAVLLSRPFWMWGAEMGANDRGVVIGNEAVFTRQPYAKVGLTGMDLLRLALERAGTAHDAVQVIITLLERHGQGGGCGHEHRSFTYHNSFLVADPAAAFVLETAGPHWAVEEVAGRVRTISNGLTIPRFARNHGDRLRTRVSACRVREGLTAGAAAHATGPAHLAAALREHGGPGPRYSPLTGGMAAPCMHAGGLLASSQTTGSWVSDLRGSRPRHWATGTAAPCTGLFLPVEVASPADLGPAPIDRFDPACLWWRHEVLHRLALREPARSLPLIKADREALEAGWFAEPPDTASAAVDGDRLRAAWIERLRGLSLRDRRPPWARRYWAVRDRRAGVGRALRIDTQPSIGAA